MRGQRAAARRSRRLPAEDRGARDEQRDERAGELGERRRAAARPVAATAMTPASVPDTRGTVSSSRNRSGRLSPVKYQFAEAPAMRHRGAGDERDELLLRHDRERHGGLDREQRDEQHGPREERVEEERRSPGGVAPSRS